MFSLQTKRDIYLTKTPVQLNCKLHHILMPLQVECDCCDLQELEYLENFACFAVKQNVIVIFTDHIFSSGD